MPVITDTWIIKNLSKSTHQFFLYTFYFVHQLPSQPPLQTFNIYFKVGTDSLAKSTCLKRNWGGKACHSFFLALYLVTNCNETKPFDKNLKYLSCYQICLNCFLIIQVDGMCISVHFSGEDG